MGKGINELEFDEFEELLGEIPNATSGTATNPEESGLINFSKDVERVSLNPLNGSLGDEIQNNGTLDEEKLSVHKIQQSHIKKVQQEEEPNLPDDQSLTSAFADLSFNEGATAEAAMPPLANFRPFQNHPILINGQLPSNVDSRAVYVPYFGSQNNSLGNFEMLGAKTSFQELRKQSAGYFQPIENFSGSLPFTNGVPGYQVHGLEFPNFSDQRHYFMDTQSQIPYLHSHQLNQSHVAWMSMEEERYYRMQKQYLYMQQLRSQRLESQHSIQANGNVAARLTSYNVRQQHNELSDQEGMRNKATVSRSINLSNPVLSSADFNKMQGWDMLGKRCFPEKILTRSHGLNSLRSVKFGSFVGNELLAEVNQNGRVLSNGNCHQSLSNSDAALQLNSGSLRGLLSDSVDLKLNSSRPLLQYNSVDEIAGRIYFLAKDQHGCRFLQKKFTEGTQEDVEKIFLEIIVHIVELMTDPFGNYLVQKLLEVCDEDQRMQILCAITRRCGDLVRISCDMHGTRAVQKVIETLKTREQCSMVVSSLKPGIVTVIKNMNGNHVAQRCLQYLMPEYCEFLFEAAIDNCVELATDRHGCCVLQKCLSHADGDQRHRLISKITSNALILSQDPFGNYVVQFIFEIHAPWATVDILDQLEGSYGDLSMQKYSSNVVEKCLKYAGEERRSCIIKELVNTPRLDQIMQDPYGNYVIQAALNNSKGSLHAALQLSEEIIYGVYSAVKSLVR
ncbi:hypothetical protein Vadar_018059 [Vaccinium darrowii]|uniref:Uncharacterized protein n=1 Tax=Vaccinium darrowii TaxID=229202 RepID=A0ACB7XB79_9ERIC|nr:hypothetical protein Vadar_018059 [Vaccinium darrowii]